MSVSNLIQRKDVNDVLDQIIPPYDRAQRAVLRVPCGSSPQLIGTAFDYALRLDVQRRCPDARNRKWIAESAVHYVESRLARLEATRGTGLVRARGEPTSSRQWPELGRIAGRARRRVENAKIFLRKHVRRRRCDRAWMTRLAEHALRLARLDPIFRAGWTTSAIPAESSPTAWRRLVGDRIAGLAVPPAALADVPFHKLPSAVYPWRTWIVLVPHVGQTDQRLMRRSQETSLRVASSMSLWSHGTSSSAAPRTR